MMFTKLTVRGSRAASHAYAANRPTVHCEICGFLWAMEEIALADVCCAAEVA
jgi:hypothetical protein